MQTTEIDEHTKQKLIQNYQCFRQPHAHKASPNEKKLMNRVDLRKIEQMRAENVETKTVGNHSVSQTV